MSKQHPTIRLICWKEDRAAELAAELEAAGFAVDAGTVDGSALKALGESPPDAVVIDLGRLPAQGRDVGIMLRTRATSRHVPVIFIDGADDKVARTRELLPDAVYAMRAEMAEAVPRTALAPARRATSRQRLGSLRASSAIW